MVSTASFNILAGVVTALLMLSPARGATTETGVSGESIVASSTGVATSMKSTGAPSMNARPVSNFTMSTAGVVKISPGPETTGDDGTVYTTEVVTAYTTYCPGPTKITQGSKTITVTSATTLIVTDCPCTILKPVTQGPKPPAPGSTIPPGQISVFHGEGHVFGPQGALMAWLAGLAAVLL